MSDIYDIESSWRDFHTGIPEGASSADQEDTARRRREAEAVMLSTLRYHRSVAWLKSCRTPIFLLAEREAPSRLAVDPERAVEAIGAEEAHQKNKGI